MARCFDANGNPLGNEVMVTQTSGGKRRAPAVAVASNGKLLVVWQARAQDGAGDGVFGWRSFGWAGTDDSLFADGFETGSTGAWSGVTP